MERSTNHTRQDPRNFRVMILFICVAVIAVLAVLFSSCDKTVFTDKVYEGDHFEIHYPYFLTEKYSDINELICDRLKACEDISYYINDNSLEGESKLTASYLEPYISDRYISVAFSCYAYDIHAAHPSLFYITVNYDIDSHKTVENIEFKYDEILNAVNEQLDEDHRIAAMYSMESEAFLSDLDWAMDAEGYIVYITVGHAAGDCVSVRLPYDSID